MTVGRAATAAVIGDLNVDLVVNLPDPAQTDLKQEPVLSRGGSSANTAAVLAGLGVDTSFVGTVGDDVFGSTAKGLLAAAGVEVGRVRAVDTATVVVIVVVQPGGERLIYVWPPVGGAQLELDEAEAVGGVNGVDWLHISGIMLRGASAARSVLRAMESARSQGVSVSLDLNLRLENWGWNELFRTNLDAAIDTADVVFGSVSGELSPLVGVDDPVVAVARLAGANRLVVGRLGSEGAIAHDGRRLYESPGRRVEVVNAVGAGDAFNAGFIAARLGGASLDESLRYANAVAGVAISRPRGSATPNSEEIARFLGA